MAIEKSLTAFRKEGGGGAHTRDLIEWLSDVIPKAISLFQIFFVNTQAERII